MSDLIERDKAIEAIRKAVTKECAEWSVKELPSAQPERKKGKWVRPFGAQTSSYRFLCSECGEIAYQVTGNCGRKYKIPQKCTYKWCPNCGADMRGEQDEEFD